LYLATRYQVENFSPPRWFFPIRKCSEVIHLFILHITPLYKYYLLLVNVCLSVYLHAFAVNLTDGVDNGSTSNGALVSGKQILNCPSYRNPYCEMYEVVIGAQNVQWLPLWCCRAIKRANFTYIALYANRVVSCATTIVDNDTFIAFHMSVASEQNKTKQKMST
jgi:hypothetical protein